MLSDENKALVERIIREPIASYLIAGNSIAVGPEGMNALLDAARSEPPADLKAVREALERISAGLATAQVLMEASGHWRTPAGYMTDAALWIERSARAAEVYAPLNLSETVDGK